MPFLYVADTFVVPPLALKAECAGLEIPELGLHLKATDLSTIVMKNGGTSVAVTSLKKHRNECGLLVRVPQIPEVMTLKFEWRMTFGQNRFRRAAEHVIRMRVRNWRPDMEFVSTVPDFWRDRQGVPLPALSISFLPFYPGDAATIHSPRHVEYSWMPVQGARFLLVEKQEEWLEADEGDFDRFSLFAGQPICENIVHPQWDHAVQGGFNAAEVEKSVAQIPSESGKYALNPQVLSAARSLLRAAYTQPCAEAQSEDGKSSVKLMLPHFLIALRAIEKISAEGLNLAPKLSGDWWSKIEALQSNFTRDDLMFGNVELADVKLSFRDLLGPSSDRKPAVTRLTFHFREGDKEGFCRLIDILRVVDRASAEGVLPRMTTDDSRYWWKVLLDLYGLDHLNDLNRALAPND